jgi:hypothetical protein
MRLWSIHPKYLDTKGLGALWREALLAQAVLSNRTKGWKNHPQLVRFKGDRNPVSAVGFYLLRIHEEASLRRYNYDISKIKKPVNEIEPIEITDGQLNYEMFILLERLELRSPEKFAELQELRGVCDYPEPHPIFNVIEGEVGSWETSYWRRV